MDIYLPIAEVSVNWPTLVLLGAVVGFVSGLFGIGGGFLMAPILVFLGIPPTVAVASQASHVVASSTSGVISYSSQGAVDYRMGGIMALGGALGAVGGVELFRWLRLLGQADLVVAVSYLVFLGAIGSLMLRESLTQIVMRAKGLTPPRKERRRPLWLYGLPWKVRFPKSGLYISAIPPLALGVFAGVLSAIMGVGGGFILVPAMLYVLRMKASVVVGTSLFQIIITTAITTILQAGRNQTVDIVLSSLLLFGGVIGAQYGARLSGRFRGEVLRAALAVIVLIVAMQMGSDLFVRPGDMFALAPGIAGLMLQALPPPPPAAEAPMIAAPERSIATTGETRIAAALTDARVMVDSSFRGASIVLYGAVFNPTDAPADVVVVVRGPDGPVRLVRKTRQAGVWLNSRPVLFEGAPGFYMTASTRPLNDIANFGELRRLGVGVDHLRIAAPQETRTVTRYGVRDVVVSRLGEDYLEWRRAVIRLREAAALYNTDPEGVEFVDKGLFRAEVELPAVAPTGQYYAEVWLFQDGQPVSVSNLTLTVEKVGIERDIYEFAHRRPWTYGLLCVLLAALTGWTASRVFRRT